MTATAPAAVAATVATTAVATAAVAATGTGGATLRDSRNLRRWQRGDSVVVLTSVIRGTRAAAGGHLHGRPMGELQPMQNFNLKFTLRSHPEDSLNTQSTWQCIPTLLMLSYTGFGPFAERLPRCTQLSPARLKAGVWFTGRTMVHDVRSKERADTVHCCCRDLESRGLPIHTSARHKRTQKCTVQVKKHTITRLQATYLALRKEPGIPQDHHPATGTILLTRMSRADAGLPSVASHWRVASIVESPCVPFQEPAMAPSPPAHIPHYNDGLSSILATA